MHRIAKTSKLDNSFDMCMCGGRIFWGIVRLDGYGVLAWLIGTLVVEYFS